MSAPVPTGAGIIEVTLAANDGFPRCCNGGVGECPATMPSEVGRVLSETEWRQIVEAFDVETGCSAGAVAMVLLLVPTFGLSFVGNYILQARKAWRINRRLQNIAGDKMQDRGGTIGFEMGHETASGIKVRPRLWIKPPKISI